jgi:RHS repeat-associated protein
VFSSAGSYLNLHAVTGQAGIANFRLPEGTYRFRGDYQGSQFWVTESILGNQLKGVNLNTGGGLFTLRVEKSAGVALADKPVYVFTPSGSYLNLTAQTNAQGEVAFGLAAGWYRFRVDYMGYQFWCNALEVPSTLSHTMSIVHRESTIAVNTFYTGAMVPLEGVKGYLFTEAGSYLNLNATTDAQGQVRFQVPDQNYKVRVDYLGGQYWSEVFRWQDKDVVIDEGMVDLHVTWNGQEVNGAPVYLFTDTGAYLSKNVTTDAQGHARFTVPVKPYKFRIDYNGRQYWTSVITPIAHQPLEIAVPLEQLALTPTNDPLCKRVDDSLDKDFLIAGMPDHFALSDSSFIVQHSSLSLRDQGIRVASIGSLVGLITHSAVAQVAQTKVYYYLTDHLGTPQKVMDNAGVVVWSGDYRPFGEVTSGVSTIQNHFRFPGQYFEKETRLHYNYHRYYQPTVGRYVTPDPMGLIGGVNLYAYVHNAPIKIIDPRGLLFAPWHFGTSLVAGLVSGKDIIASLSFAWDSMAVDWAPGTQGLGAEATVQHAMAGMLPNGDYETLKEAIDAADYYINRNAELGNCAEAAHAAQDLATPSHAGKRWEGFGWNWNTISHILSDLFPSTPTAILALLNTLGTIR